MAEVLRAENVSCARELRSDDTSRVRELSLALESGTTNVLCGPEGCGKNLLLRLLGLLEIPDAGQIFLHEVSTAKLAENERLELRNRRFGFVFAEPFLLNTFSVVENVAMPLFKISGTGLEQARASIAEVLKFVGLDGAEETPIASLALLAQKKVSLARALAIHPKILLAENVDAQLASHELLEFTDLLTHASQAFAITVILTAQRAGSLPQPARIIEMESGRIVRDSQQREVTTF